MIKNIVLLSDGTGNSSESPFKTNVWRMYQAVDIQPPATPAVREQIVYYDNGVGTENFKPLAALGGAFGIGVWKNVRDIYTFVCRNYQPGDQIYGFGFSRGAFTIRLVMGLIAKCGVVKTNPHSEVKLLEAVQMAYEAYRRDFLLRASRHRNMIYHWFLREPRYLRDEEGQRTNFIDLTNGEDDSITQNFFDIPFLGVWDTVDAYGMPVDELKMAIDRRVWPLSFADRDPSPRIQVIRHALSLDDERPTFRPVLWNEMVPDPAQPGNATTRVVLPSNRIQQVWFSGMHANVGGGYPDDGLAYVALNWMMTEAAQCGLRFFGPDRTEAEERVNPHGEQYDSRAGLAGYYRYGPRSLALLTDDRLHKVSVPVTWVHVDAFDRVARQQRAYAPVSLNKQFQLTGGNPAQYPPIPYMTAELELLERAWDIVWWRRLTYFATLIATMFVALFFGALVFTWPNSILALVENAISAVVGKNIEMQLTLAFQKSGSALGSMLPGWLAAVLPEISKYPLTAVISIALLAILFIWVSAALQGRIAAYAEWAWGDQKGLPPARAPTPGWLNTIARRGRKVTASLYWVLWRPIAVHLLGVLIGLSVLPVIVLVWLIRLPRRRPWMA